MKFSKALDLLALTALLVPAYAAPAVAQEVFPIEIGDRVRVSVPMQIDGDVVGFGDGQLIIRIPNHVDLTSVPFEALEALHVGRMRTKALLFGALGGVAAGVGAWILVDQSNAIRVESLAPAETDRRAYTAAFAAVGGAFAGALFGRRYKSYTWEVVPLATLRDRFVRLDGVGLRATWTLP